MSLVALRMGVFAALLALLLVAERVWPRRAARGARDYAVNAGIFMIDSVLTRLLLAMGGVAAALMAQEREWGVLNIFDMPAWVAWIAAVVALDLAVWVQHVATHKIPVLWRLHEIHHADTHVDVSTGLRFHPVEIALSLLFKSAVVVALGAPVGAVILFEVLLNGGAMFSHSNLRLHARVDGVLRLITVTPDMHRVHHSVRDDEANSNYGFFLPWWDRLFRTYRAQPREGHAAMGLGVKGSPDRGLRTLLVRPFVPRARAKPAR